MSFSESHNNLLPQHLQGNKCRGGVAQQCIAQFEIGTMKNFIYLLIDWNQKKAVVVDPQADLAPWLQWLQEHAIELEGILLTHTHFDHTAGVGPLLEKFTSLWLGVGKPDLRRLPQAWVRQLEKRGCLKLWDDEQIFQVGSLEVKALSTPGHSSGEYCYWIQKQPGVDRPYLFTGDTLFIRDCGRTDLESGNDAEMFASLQKIKSLPPETVLLVGHHYAPECATTLGIELQTSPPLQCKSVAELSALA